MVVCAL